MTTAHAPFVPPVRATVTEPPEPEPGEPEDGELHDEGAGPDPDAEDDEVGGEG
jgi:hypothetical protein